MSGATRLGARGRVEAGAAAVLAALPAPVARVLAGRPVRVDGQRLDPYVQLAIRLERLLGGWEPLPAPEARAHRLHEALVFRGRTIAVGGVRDLELPGPAGTLRARLYEPPAISSPAALVVYFHGGGHVIGDLETHDQPCRLLARETRAIVVAIDYRLGPEHRFPAAVDDAFAAFRWAHAEAATLGADPARIALAGDSAGGNLAAVVAQLAAAGGGPAPAFQALMYPVTDYSAKRRSYELFGQGFFLTREEMDWFRDNYFGGADQHSDPRASPLLAADLSGVAPAHVVTAGFDPLRDEGEAYAQRLLEHGVPTTLRREPDLVHGFINAVGLGGRALEAATAFAAALRDGLDPAAEPRVARAAATLLDAPG